MAHTDAVLLVEFYADDDAEGRQKVADLVADRVPDADTEAGPPSARWRPTTLRWGCCGHARRVLSVATR